MITQTIFDLPFLYALPGEQTVNDNDSFLVFYSGSGWTYGTGSNALNRINVDEHYTKISSSYVEFTFVGSNVKWIATKFTNRGTASVYLDGVFQTLVDEYNSVVLYQQVVYEKNNFNTGSHVLKIVCTGTKNASASDTYIDVDAFKYR